MKATYTLARHISCEKSFEEIKHKNCIIVRHGEICAQFHVYNKLDGSCEMYLWKSNLLAEIYKSVMAKMEIGKEKTFIVK